MSDKATKKRRIPGTTENTTMKEKLLHQYAKRQPREFLQIAMSHSNGYTFDEDDGEFYYPIESSHTVELMPGDQTIRILVPNGHVFSHNPKALGNELRGIADELMKGSFSGLLRA